MLLAGTGGVLLISGIGGESVADVLKGSFGKLKFDPKAGLKKSDTERLEQQGTTAEGEGSPAPSPTSFSSATFAPSPQSLSRHPLHPTKYQQAQGIAAILLHEGIRNPTKRQIEDARKRYERETGVRQFEGDGAQEFIGGLPVV